MTKLSKLVALVVLLIIGTNKVSSQEVKLSKQLDSMALKMFKDVNNKDFESIMDMTHPKVFEIVPREAMVNVFKTMFEGNNEYTIEIPKETPEYKLTEVKNDIESNTDYAFVSYHMKMKMTFNDQEFGDEEKEMMVNMMKLQEMHVRFISDNAMDVTMKNRVVILLNSDATNNEWSMLNYDKDSPLLYQILPTGIIEKTKEYHQDLMLETKKNEKN